jgi:hypothetical protein
VLTLAKKGGGRFPVDVGGGIDDGNEELFKLLDCDLKVK